MAKMYIDLYKIKQNAVRLTEKAPLIAVVKADSYGINSVKVASIMRDIVDIFAVWTLKEAYELIEGGIQNDILILGIVDEKVRNGNIIITARCIYDLNFASDMVAISLDTGMNRLGVDKSTMLLLLREASSKSIKIHSVYSHLFCVDDNLITSNQIKLFNSCTDDLGIKRHLFASRASEVCDTSKCDFIRCGIALYDDAVEVFARVICVRRVFAGEYVGYGNKPIKNDCSVAVINIGYRDGYRQLTNDRYVWCNGQLCKVLSVCMDVCMIDVTFCVVVVGDDAEVVGKHFTTEMLGKSYGTSKYEAMTFLDRVTKYYIE